MLEALSETKSALASIGIAMVIRWESPERAAVNMSGQASLVVVDRGYLRIQKKWRRYAAQRIACSLIQVETDVVVPVEITSPKEEYAAATIRPKITRNLETYLVPLERHQPGRSSLGLDVESFDISDVDDALARLDIDTSVKATAGFRGGTQEARKHLRRFLRSRLADFAGSRNDPTREGLSNMSPYLHFGQISPLYIALEVRKAGEPGVEAYLEELIVRRELSMNFVHYNGAYYSYKGLPAWARETLGKHRSDSRDFTYSLRQFEDARTHDPYWNAAQDEMCLTGKMHGYMRMYWGKKIIEWTRTPQYAFRIALHLNNKYELDGRDPNGFAGVAWCFGKHDRPWGERKIFGNVRYMNDKGLKRKFDADAYVAKVSALKQRMQHAGRGDER
jgi:deoxyribodipyrimidine photo-lyase